MNRRCVEGMNFLSTIKKSFIYVPRTWTSRRANSNGDSLASSSNSESKSPSQPSRWSNRTVHMLNPCRPSLIGYKWARTDQVQIGAAHSPSLPFNPPLLQLLSLCCNSRRTLQPSIHIGNFWISPCVSESASFQCFQCSLAISAKRLSKFFKSMQAVLVWSEVSHFCDHDSVVCLTVWISCNQAKMSRGRTVGKKAISRSTKAGLQFPVGRIARLIKAGKFATRVGAGAPVYLAAVLEYLAAEVSLLLYPWLFVCGFCILVRSGGCSLGKIFSQRMML